MSYNVPPLISVIIPVFNSELFLDNCIASVVCQTYKSLEIILIDDGSTDDSGSICEKWHLEDRRITVIHQANNGVGSARNRGLSIAQGEFITFVDSDDMLSPNMLQNSLIMLKDTKSDLSIVGVSRIIPDEAQKPVYKVGKSILMNSEDAFRYVNIPGYFDVGPWAKLFKRELLNGVSFPNDTNGQDYPVIYESLDRAHQVIYNSTEMYYYRQSNNGLSKQIDMAPCIYTKDMVDLVQRKYPSALSSAWYSHIDSTFGMANIIIRNKLESKWENYLSYTRKLIRDHWEDARNTPNVSSVWLIRMRLFSFSPRFYSLILRCLYKAKMIITSNN